MRSNKTLVIRNGTLIDGSGRGAARNETIVIEGSRIKSIGPLPPDVAIEDRRSVDLEPRNDLLTFQQAAE